MKIFHGKREEYFKNGKYFEELINNPPMTITVNNFKDGNEWLKNKIHELRFTSCCLHCNFSKRKNCRTTWKRYFNHE